MAIVNTNTESAGKANQVITGSTSNTDNGKIASIFVLSGGAAKNKGCNRFYLYIIATLLMTVVTLSVALLLLINNNVPETPKPRALLSNKDNTTSMPTSTLHTDIASQNIPHKFHILTRRDWVAQPPIQASNKLPLPVPYVIIMHTATENCSSIAQCIYHVRSIQTFHIESHNWYDIGYNFLVGGDGNAYQGRGWTKQGAHTYGYNANSIGIAFIGTFEKYKPPETQMIACKQLIQKGVELGYISPQYKLLAARQVVTSSSPGKALYEEIQTWPHWIPSP